MPRISEIEQLGIGDEVVLMRTKGHTHQAIADKFGVSRGQVQAYLSKIGNLDLITAKSITTGVMRLELSRENARSEFMKYISELYRRYDRVKDSEESLDRQEATAILRLLDGAIDKYLRVTGLYDRAKREADSEEAQDIKITVNWVSGGKN